MVPRGVSLREMDRAQSSKQVKVMNIHARLMHDSMNQLGPPPQTPATANSRWATHHQSGGRVGSRLRPVLTLLSALRMSSIARRVGKLVPEHSALLLCDIQERFRELIWHFPQVVRTAKLMTDVGKVLGIPSIATEQYPERLGPTVSEIPLVNDGYTIAHFDKKLFSMITPEVKSHLESLNRKSVLLFGIEAHVCVQLTALDLIEQGYEVHILVDGVSSQRPHDRATALRRMEQSGAFLTTSESAIFMLTGAADHTHFKAASGLIKEHAKNENPFNNVSGL